MASILSRPVGKERVTVTSREDRVRQDDVWCDIHMPLYCRCISRSQENVATVKHLLNWQKWNRKCHIK
jgi:hypothetical protein